MTAPSAANGGGSTDGPDRAPDPLTQARLAAWCLVSARTATNGSDWRHLINRYLAAVTTTPDIDEPLALTLLADGLTLVARFEAQCLARARGEPVTDLLDRHERQWLHILTPDHTT